MEIKKTYVYLLIVAFISLLALTLSINISTTKKDIELDYFYVFNKKYNAQEDKRIYKINLEDEINIKEITPVKLKFKNQNICYKEEKHIVNDEKTIIILFKVYEKTNDECKKDLKTKNFETYDYTFYITSKK